MYLQNDDHERLMRLIVSLANVMNKDMVIETIESILGVKAIEKDDCVHFDNLAVRFGDDDRVRNLYRVIDGATRPPNRYDG